MAAAEPFVTSLTGHTVRFQRSPVVHGRSPTVARPRRTGREVNRGHPALHPGARRVARSTRAAGVEGSPRAPAFGGPRCPQKSRAQSLVGAWPLREPAASSTWRVPPRRRPASRIAREPPATPWPPKIASANTRGESDLGRYTIRRVASTSVAEVARNLRRWNRQVHLATYTNKRNIPMPRPTPKPQTLASLHRTAITRATGTTRRVPRLSTIYKRAVARIGRTR